MAYKSPDGPRAYGPQAFTAPCRRWKGSPDGANHRRRLAPRPVARFFGLFSIKRLAEASIVANTPDPAYRREILRRPGQNISGRSIGCALRTEPSAGVGRSGREEDKGLVLDRPGVDDL